MQKRLINSNWLFSKAGQGCFYAGEIISRSKHVFNFVYDCGSSQGKSILRKEIREHKQRLSKSGDTIDLLVLSHLDSDHINLIDYLLRDITCKTVVLPYLNAVERAFLYFAAGFDDTTDEELYASFLTDPAGFLIENGAEKVIFITGNAENGIPRSGSIDPDGPEGNATANSNQDEAIFRTQILLPEESSYFTDDQDMEMLRFGRQQKVEFRRANASIKAGSHWEFFFWQIEQIPAQIIKFHIKLMQQFGIKKEGRLNAQELKDIFAQPSKVDEFKSIFKSFFKETNSTGLVVMHGPINQYASFYSDSEGHYYEGGPCWSLLTGDTDLHNHYPKRIDNNLPNIRMFQVPHHGSENNWDLNKILTLKACKLVANFGTKNSYGHPSEKIRLDILSKATSWQMVENTEYQSFHYDIYAYQRASGSVPHPSPLGRSHQPIITTSEYRSIDEQENLGQQTDARALSMGRSQWEPTEFSVKVWRHVNGRWSGQSEEMPLHRALDLAILVISTMIHRRTNHFSSNFIDLEVIRPDELEELLEFVGEKEGILSERLYELDILIREYLNRI